MDIKQKIINIISETLGTHPSKLSQESDLRQDLNADELEISDLIMKLESHFKTTISKQEARDVKTVGDLIELIKSS